MSLLSGSGTNLPGVERRTLFAFLALYAGFTLLVLMLLALLYYRFNEELMLEQRRLELLDASNTHIARLKSLHVNFDRTRTYPRASDYNSAIFDWDGVEIFSTLASPLVRLDKVIYRSGDSIHFIREPESYYLGARFVVLEVPDDRAWLARTWRDIAVYGGGLFALFVTVGWFLMKLFLRPMRRTLALLDRFIKDTTHELNTPVTAILTNIESIDAEHADPRLRKKLARIELGARTISHLYEDLTYLVLHHKVASHDEPLALTPLLKERLDYFDAGVRQKRLSAAFDAQAAPTLHMDRRKLTRLIDNLLGNALKYNRPGGSIRVTLHSDRFLIEDTGRGIPEDKLQKIFERYARFDRSAGGFGIGLSIVAIIAEEYGLRVAFESEEDKGTKVSVVWSAS